MAIKARVVRSLTCRYCGAPLEAGPDDVLVVCRRCGRVNWLRGAERPMLAVGALSREELTRVFDGLASRDPDLRREYMGVARLEIIYFPFYAGRVAARTRYAARVVVAKTRVVCRGGRCETRTETRTVRVTGEVGGVYTALIPARRLAGDMVVDDVARRVLGLYEAGGLRGAEQIDWSRADEVLAAELSVEEAERRLVGEACEALLEAAEEDAMSRAAARTGGGVAVSVEWIRAPCRVEEARVESLVYAPYARVYYATRSGVYRAYLYAWDGAPIEREEPFLDKQRVAVAAIGGFVAAGGWGLAALLAGLHAGIEGLLASVLVAGLSTMLSRDLLYGAANLLYRVERGRGGSWLSSLPSTLSAMLRLKGSILGRLLGGR